MDVAQFLKESWGYAIVLVPGVWALVRSYSKGRVDLVKVAQDAAAGVIQSLKDRLDEVEKELAHLRKTHIEMIEAKDARITMLEAEVRRWRAHAESYERMLEANNIPHTKPEQTIWEAKDQGLVMMSMGPLP